MEGSFKGRGCMFLRVNGIKCESLILCKKNKNKNNNMFINYINLCLFNVLYKCEIKILFDKLYMVVLMFCIKF